MSRYTVAVTDTRFDDLSIEREGLADLADVRVLPEDRERALEGERPPNVVNGVGTVEGDGGIGGSGEEVAE